MHQENKLFQNLPPNSSLYYEKMYANDSVRFGKAREHCEDLWRDFAPHADRHFLSEFRGSIPDRELGNLRTHARWFEMYLTVSLMRLGLDIRCPKPGPDILITAGSRRVWIEAVCASTGQTALPDSVPEPEYDKAMSTPIDKYVLRIRNSLDDKAEKFRTYISKGVVGREDLLVIAINVGLVNLMPHLYHCMRRSLYGEGDLILHFDKRTGRVVRTHYETTPEVSKRSGSPVGLTPFIDGSMGHISAAMASWATAQYPPVGLGDDCVLYPNLSSVNAWPKGMLPMGEEWFVRESDDREDEWGLTKIIHTLRRKDAGNGE